MMAQTDTLVIEGIKINIQDMLTLASKLQLAPKDYPFQYDTTKCRIKSYYVGSAANITINNSCVLYEGWIPIGKITHSNKKGEPAIFILDETGIVNARPISTYHGQNEDAMEKTKTFIKEKKTEKMWDDYLKVLTNYHNKLQNDLPKTMGVEDAYTLERGAGSTHPLEKTLVQITKEKYEIVTQAINALGNKPQEPAEAIKACLAILQQPNNRRVLAQHRDSWLVKMAKMACNNLGLTALYRALMGETAGMKHVNMFAKDSKALGIELDDAASSNTPPPTHSL